MSGQIIYRGYMIIVTTVACQILDDQGGLVPENFLSVEKAKEYIDKIA